MASPRAVFERPVNSPPPTLYVHAPRARRCIAAEYTQT